MLSRFEAASGKGPTVAHCAHCGKNYDAAEWQQLPDKGEMESGIPGVMLDLRDCPCMPAPRPTIASARYHGLYIDAATLAILEREYDERLVLMVPAVAS